MSRLGNFISYQVEGISLQAGDVLKQRVYMKLEEYSYIKPYSDCISRFYANGTLDLKVTENVEGAVQLPEFYHYDWANGFTLYNEHLSSTQNIPALSLNSDLDTTNYTSQWVDIPLTVPLRTIVANDRSQIRSTFTGNFSWVGCTIDTSTNMLPSIELRYISREGPATQLRRNGVISFLDLTDQTVQLSVAALLAGGQEYGLSVQARVILWYYGTVPTDCVQSFTLDGTLKIENFPRVAGS